MLKKFILSNEFYEVQLSIHEKDDHAHLSVMDNAEGIEVVVDKTDVEQIISLLESSLKSFK